MITSRQRVFGLIASLLLVSVVFAQQDSPPQKTPNTCLLFAARNISTGNANFFFYCTFSKSSVAIAKGDLFEYDIFLPAGNPEAVGGIDFDFEDGGNLR